MAPVNSSVADPAPEPPVEPALTNLALREMPWTTADQVAWERFFEDNYEVLVAAGTWWGHSREDAEDAVDEALVELRLRWHHIRNRAGYARRMVINHVTRVQRGDKAMIKRIVTRTAFTVERCDDHGLTSYEVEQWVLQLFDLLPPTQRAVMERLYDGLSYQEIAVQLGKTTETVRKHLQLARVRLKQELRRQREREGGQPAAASSPATATRKETA